MEQILFTTKEQESLKAWMDDHGEVGQLILREQDVAPPVSELGHAVMYWDDALDAMLCSVDGAPFVPCVSAAPTVAPGDPVGSFQFNDNGVFGGADLLYASAFGLAEVGSAADNTTALNAALAQLVLQGGGTLVIPHGTYDLNTTDPVTVAADIRGELGTVLALQPGQTAFTIAVDEAVAVRGFTMRGGARGVLMQGPDVFPITAVNQGTKTFTVSGDHAAAFTPGAVQALVRDATGNVGAYTVVSAIFAAGVTDIVVTQSIPSAVADGTIAPPDLSGTFALIEDNVFTGQTLAGIDVASTANQWTIRRNVIEAGTGVGIRTALLTDSCECSIDGNTIATMAGGGFSWIGGGDLRITNNKMFDFTHFVAPLISLVNQGVPTSEIVIASNALSGGLNNLLLGGTIVTQGIVLGPNQWNNSTGPNIHVTGSGVSGLAISGGFIGASNDPIVLDAGDQVTIGGGLQLLAFAGGLTGITVGVAASSVRIDDVHYSGFSPEVDNASGSTALSTFATLTFAQLPAVAGAGSLVTCNGCSPTTPCTIGGEVLTAYRNGAGQWACRPADSVTGGGTAKQVTVWDGPNTLAGYTAFTFSPSTILLTTGDPVALSGGSGGNLDAAVLGAAGTTLVETPGRLEFAFVGGTVGTRLDASGGNVEAVAVLGTNNATMQGVFSLIAGSDGGSIGADALQAVVLGGTSGSVAAAIHNGVSLNGGVVTADNTTVYADYLQSNGRAFALLGAPSNGTMLWCTDCTATSPCTGGGSGAFAFRVGGVWECSLTSTSSATGSGETTRIAVWSGTTTLGSFADLTWNETNSNFVAGLTPSLGSGATKSVILGGVSGSIGSNATSCVVLGDGHVDPGLTSVVALNGGTGTSSQTTVYASFLQSMGVPYASLLGRSNGTTVYCTNCDPTATLLTCTNVGAQTGAIAFLVNGAWKCIG